MDAQAFASLAQIRILLVPVGSIRRSTFDRWAAEVRAFDAIRLGDVPADNRDDRARFMPSPLSTGHLHLSFPSHPPPPSLTPLRLFRPSHFPLGVIGIADCSQSTLSSTILAHFDAALSEVFPSESVFPLARNCFAFEEGDGNTHLDVGDHLPGLVIIPSVMSNKKLYIGTLLAELCSGILGQMSVMVRTLESPLGSELLGASLLPNFQLSPDPQPPITEETNHRDSVTPLPVFQSQPELSANSSTTRPKGSPAFSLKHNSSIGPGASLTETATSRNSSLTVPSTKKRQSGASLQPSHARLYKVLGDFFLLAGRTLDASIWYNEAIALFKTSQDLIWHASALEGIVSAGVLDAWAAGHGLNTTSSNNKEPWADHSEKLVQAISIYSKVTVVSDAQQYSCIAYLYTTSVLRYASLLFSIWSAKGWGPLAFMAMLHPAPLKYVPSILAPPDPSTTAHLDRMSTITGISRSDISAVLSQAHGPWLLHLGRRECIEVLEVMVRMFSCLGYRRKEVIILREVVGCIMDLITHGREEAAEQTRPSRSSAIDFGIQAIGSGEVHVDDQGHVEAGRQENVDGNDSVLQLMKYICNVHGIDLDIVRFCKERVGSQKGASQGPSIAFEDTEEEFIGMSTETQGWPEMQVGIVREALAVAEALPDYPAVARSAFSAMKTLYPVLEADDQYHLHLASARALTTARRRGEQLQLEYWSGNPLVNIEVLPSHSTHIPIERPSSDFNLRFPDILVDLNSKIDPFLYNPKRSLARKTRRQNLVVQNELLRFTVTLQNPYSVVLELQQVSLSTSGTLFESRSVPVMLQPNSFHQITLSGKTHQTGNLIIRGCIVKTPWSAPREFILPLPDEGMEEKRPTTRSAFAFEATRLKYTGLDARLAHMVKRRQRDNVLSSHATPFQFMTLKVVPEQPLLRIRRTSLTHNAIMLYDGETSHIRLTLENVSPLPIDFLQLTFDDSLKKDAEQALAESVLSVFGTYEAEFNLHHKPVFSWDSNAGVGSILPGKEFIATVSCFGRVGCTNGTIHLAYSYARRQQESLQKPFETFYTRQLTYPVLFTVYQMLECHSMDIHPYTQVESACDHRPVKSQAQRVLLEEIHETGWCLFTLDVRNTYGQPFEVRFMRREEGISEVSVSQIIPPGSTHRIILPIRRFSLPDSVVSAAIPTLTERQFVVAKTALTDEEEKLQRELFWYREELFKRVRAQWQEAGGTRSGQLTFRDQRLTLPMLNALRATAVCILATMSHYDDCKVVDAFENAISITRSKFWMSPNTFAVLRIRIINISSVPLSLTISLNVEPKNLVVFDGILSHIPIGRLESDESRQLEKTFCFLAQGHFQVSWQVQKIDGIPSAEPVAGEGELRVVVRDDVSSTETLHNLAINRT